MELRTMDVKFWLDNFKNEYRQLLTSFDKLKEKVMTDLETFQFKLDRKLDIQAMRDNMDTLKGLLMVKFKQVEDVKDGLRDMLVYQKYFFPIKIQGMITDNMRQFRLATEDTLFSSYQKNIYDAMFADLEKLTNLADYGRDVDLEVQLKELAKQHL